MLQLRTEEVQKKPVTILFPHWQCILGQFGWLCVVNFQQTSYGDSVSLLFAAFPLPSDNSLGVMLPNCSLDPWKHETWNSCWTLFYSWSCPYLSLTPSFSSSIGSWKHWETVQNPINLRVERTRLEKGCFGAWIQCIDNCFSILPYWYLVASYAVLTAVYTIRLRLYLTLVAQAMLEQLYPHFFGEERNGKPSLFKILFMNTKTGDFFELWIYTLILALELWKIEFTSGYRLWCTNFYCDRSL